MSAIYVQIGQCGNQVGQCFWKEALGTLGNDRRKCEVKSAKHLEYGERLSSLLTYSGKLPLILLDSEAKPARALHASRELGQFIREENVIVDKTGRGGNWAFGYSGGKKGGRRNELLEQVTERHRREIERCERFSGTVVFHSLAGGTGSGLGSRFVEEVRTEYPRSTILSVAIAPHSHGESPLQHYNSLLALSHLQQFADGVVLFQNDSVLEDVMKTSQKSAPGKVSSCSLDDMNAYIGGCMANALMPIYTSNKRGDTCGNITFDLATSGCPNSRMKFLTPVYASNPSAMKTPWDRVVNRVLFSSSMSPAAMEGRKRSTTNMVAVVRSTKNNMADFDNNVAANFELKCRKNFTSSGKDSFPCLVSRSIEVDFKERKAISTFCNSSIISGYIGSVLRKSKAKLDCGAYVHWYEDYGCTDKDFGLATETCGKILANYSSVE